MWFLTSVCCLSLRTVYSERTDQQPQGEARGARLGVVLTSAMRWVKTKILGRLSECKAVERCRSVLCEVASVAVTDCMTELIHDESMSTVRSSLGSDWQQRTTAG